MTLGKTFPIQNHSKMEVIRSQGLGMHRVVSREDHTPGGLSQACCIQGLTSLILSFLIWEMVMVVNNGSYLMGLFMGLKRKSMETTKNSAGALVFNENVSCYRCCLLKGVNLDADLVRNSLGRC